jgi:molybdenum cofactor cytidylyltransferase
MSEGARASTGISKGRPVVAVVLAAGRSQRMGFPKAYLRWQGETLIERAAREAALGGCSCVVAVVGAEDDRELASVAVVEPLLHERLPAGCSLEVRCGRPDATSIDSLRVALASVQAGHDLLLWPVDYPFADRALVARLRASLLRTSDRIALPTVAGRRGHPILFGADVVHELWEPTLQAGARSVVHRRPERLVEVACVDRRVAEDVDTPEDARRLGVELPASLDPSESSPARWP